jgi:hypothetical protein
MWGVWGSIGKCLTAESENDRDPIGCISFQAQVGEWPFGCTGCDWVGAGSGMLGQVIACYQPVLTSKV